VKRILLALLVAALAATGGVAHGDVRTFTVVQGESVLPSSVFANGGDLALAPAWTVPPAQPVQLSYDQLLRLWQNAGQAYDVPWTVLAAINKIESNFGRNMGPSSAGALGWMQFMPSTWVRWGTDADANGVADPWNPVDAVYSAARYLAASGGATDIRRAVFSYNHADWYVNQVIQLAQLYGSSDTASADAFQNLPAAGSSVFALDRIQVQLDSARAAVAEASGEYRTAADRANALSDRQQQLVDRANAIALLSDRLDAQKRAALFGANVEAARGEADGFKKRLDEAQAALKRLEDEAHGASFNEPARQILSGAPVEASGNYVFPVGGGPSVVSVSHYHHDYPAADIAAPEGSPLYALSDGTVRYAWSSDPRCGVGFTMQTTDGQTWTYCHLSYLEPTVTPGAQLAAGDPVGLVGQTGHATGPHLHLQLQPADSYPQEAAWFQGFAGTAFRWADAGPTPAGANRPLVFHIVRTLD
jgi:murein DD-endopeptidase MepM/ murein hydrolase activator NlpD